MTTGKTLLSLYNRLFRALGPQHWWPGETPLEIAVGAILTQNTAWSNVEKAISNLKSAGCLNFKKLSERSAADLARLIRPAGYFNIKAKRLKTFIRWVDETYGSLDKMFERPADKLREELLSVNGIGPETADSILLYAGGKPVFVIDAYTKRIFSRHFLMSADDDYAAYQKLMMTRLPSDPRLYNEYHALIVIAGKEFCRKRNPLCTECPLNGFGWKGRKPTFSGAGLKVAPPRGHRHPVENIFSRPPGFPPG